MHAKKGLRGFDGGPIERSDITRAEDGNACDDAVRVDVDAKRDGAFCAHFSGTARVALVLIDDLRQSGEYLTVGRPGNRKLAFHFERNAFSFWEFDAE